MTVDADRFVRAMKGLCPGDVITNLVSREEDKDLKVLVLEVTAGAIQLSLKSDGLCIIRDRDGPFHWDETEQYLVKRDGKIPAHIGHGVSVLKAEGLKEVDLYNRLDQYRKFRSGLKEKDFVRFFEKEPDVLITLGALIDNDNGNTIKKMEACINYVFHGRPDPPSLREMICLLSAVCLVADRLCPTTIDVNPMVMSKKDADESGSS